MDKVYLSECVLRDVGDWIADPRRVREGDENGPLPIEIAQRLLFEILRDWAVVWDVINMVS